MSRKCFAVECAKNVVLRNSKSMLRCNYLHRYRLTVREKKQTEKSLF